MGKERPVPSVKAPERAAGKLGHLLLSSLIHGDTELAKGTVQNLLPVSPHQPCSPQICSIPMLTALNNTDMVVCNCANWAKLELHFPEFLTYAISGLSWSKRDVCKI